MKVLFILDPLRRLDLKTDASLHLLRRLAREGHSCWASDSFHLFQRDNHVLSHAVKMKPARGKKFQTSKSTVKAASFFDLILIRKEPPFDDQYLYMTYLMDYAARETCVLNHPQGLRDANEKLSSPQFSKWIPKTLITCEPKKILEFQKELKSPIVVKPLNERAGHDVILLKPNQANRVKVLNRLTRQGRNFICAQKFITGKKVISDKRITLLDGRILATYERKFAARSFKGNLHQGATYHASKITAQEKRIIREIGPWLRKKGIQLAGLDILAGTLIEINVTCPGGLVEPDRLYPKQDVFGKWIQSLKIHVRRFKKKR